MKRKQQVEYVNFSSLTGMKVVMWSQLHSSKGMIQMFACYEKVINRAVHKRLVLFKATIDDVLGLWNN
jgi:hypothetical protein